MGTTINIAILDFSDATKIGPLRDTLCALNLTVSVHAGDTLQAGVDLGTIKLFILYIDDRDEKNQQVLTAMQNLLWRPVLGVFSDESPAWPKVLVQRCDEVIAWPCNQAELSYRIDRLLLPDTTADQGTEQHINLDEMASLNLVGNSPALVSTLRLIKKVARCDVSVVIEGETGTGKELAARAIHYLGDRRDHPFIPVNCGALPEDLIENELFGHARGAYTDAREAQPGLILQAEGGTLFLDEIDSLSLKSQVSLLRFLQDQQYLPLGGREMRQANVRIIGAVNRPLQQLVGAGQFREDLFFRLNIMMVRMPPLNKRRSDILLLAEHFMRQYRIQYAEPNKKLHPQLLRWMEAHDWAGNVRELENFIHREFLLADGDYIRVECEGVATKERRHCLDRRQKFALDLKFAKAKELVITDFEKRYLRELMSQANGNVTLAAQRAGKERRAFGKLLKKHQVDKNLESPEF